ncbi:MAG: hypothetical protein HUU18_03665 [Phycisphaerales bacterium]|nr:hypothetical protein [Phycisphaerales bacterium]
MIRDPEDHPHLSPDDARALDALIDASFVLDAVPTALRERASRVASLLGLLDAGPAPVHETRLAESILARIDAASSPLELHPDDQDALDAYVAAGFQTQKVAASLRPRAQAIEALGSLIAETPAPAGRADLAERTFSRVLNAARPAPIPIGRATTSRFRMADLVSVAAMLLIGVSLLWPMIAAGRDRAQRLACASNFGTVASALGVYANDFSDALPTATASFGGSWIEVGKDPTRSNSANLFTLARADYASIESLTCPGYEKACRKVNCRKVMDWPQLDAVSYSYQVMGPRPRLRHTMDATAPILSDRSPVVLRAVAGQVIYPNENSPNHGGKGQGVLRNDGSLVWLSTPHLEKDNIWLPAIIEQALVVAQDQLARTGKVQGFTLIGNELPADQDAFLAP